MPLVRYEVRCEHSLANPELYRTAGRDDSESLLEGVAMAGLVGIVRQLGDLAEFAAEIFHDLHDDIMAIVARGQSLKARVARLEVDLPAVEKALLAEASQFRFAYSARSKWRAPLPIDQSLCAHGELPRFVRNFYDDCRGPPRLFLLDKFDEAGRGACVKRYTDPTFFRISWATTQLERAEQLRREQEAELEKKNFEAANPGRKIYARERLSSALFENLEGFTGDFTPELRSRRLDRVLEVATEGDLTPDGPRSPEEPGSPEREAGLQKRPRLPEVAQGPVLAPLKTSVKDADLKRRMAREAVSDEDEESSADFYVDALTTMGSDPDSEPGSRGRWDSDSAQSRFALDHDQVTSLNHSVLKAHVEAHRLTPPGGSEDDDEFPPRLEHGSPVAAIEWEAGESPHAQPSNESVASVESRSELAAPPVEEKQPQPLQADLPDKVPAQKTPVKPAFQSHESVSLLDSYRVKERRVTTTGAENSSEAEHKQETDDEVKQVVEQVVEQAVTTPRSRRLWAKDNDPEVTSSILSVKLNGDSELSSILRARMLESSDDATPREGQGSVASPHRSSSSSPYTNLSSSDADGYTSSASSSPRGANFGALLSPSESPPRIGRGLMGFGSRSPNLAPPITPFLSSSPSVSRCPSIADPPSVTSTSPSRLPSQKSSLPSHAAPVTSRASENGGSQVEPSRNQPSALPNPAPRPRTWVDRSESNVAATLRAIRQAAAVGSDDETGSECPSDCS